LNKFEALVLSFPILLFGPSNKRSKGDNECPESNDKVEKDGTDESRSDNPSQSNGGAYPCRPWVTRCRFQFRRQQTREYTDIIRDRQDPAKGARVGLTGKNIGKQRSRQLVGGDKQKPDHSSLIEVRAH